MILSEFNKMLPTVDRTHQPDFHKWFISYQDVVSWDVFRSQGYKYAVEVKTTIEAHVEAVEGKPKQLSLLSFIPTKLARTSPFFPMSRKDMKKRPTYTKFTMENNWGKITIRGPKLSIYDEGLLLALLLLARKYRSNHFNTNSSELCRLMGVAKGKNTYKAISESLDRLVAAFVKTELKDPDKKGKVGGVFRGHLLDNADDKEGSGKLYIKIDPQFLVMYGANLTTTLDVKARSELKGDTTKALYRFLKSHQLQNDKVPFGMITLCHGINLNTDKPLFEIRRVIRNSLKELRKKDHIGWFKIDKDDNVFITKKTQR